MSFYGGCVWEIFGSAGFLVSSVCEPAHSYHPIRFAATGSSSSYRYEEVLLMTANNPQRRFTPMKQIATSYPVLLIDSDAPLRELLSLIHI